jgi:predicted Zn-dependent protease
MAASIAAARGDHLYAAEAFFDLGRPNGDNALLRAATEEAVLGGDLLRARVYAEEWVAAGGETKARQSLAEILILGGLFNQAKRHLRILAGEGAAPADIYAQLAQVRDKSAALSFMGEIFAGRENDAEYQLYFARLARLAGDDEAALVAAAIARTLRPEWAGPVFIQAAVADDRKDADALLAALESYAVAPPANVVYAFELSRERRDYAPVLKNPAAFADDASYNAGRFFETRRMAARARLHYGEVTADSPYYAYARVGISRLLEADGDIGGAMALLEATEVDDADSFALIAVAAADLISRKDGMQAARRWFAAARQRFPREKHMLYQAAIYAEETGDLAETERLLRQMIMWYPEDADGWNALGYIFADHNIRLEESRELINRALLLRPDDANILDSAGWMHYRLGDIQKARFYLNRAAEKSDAPEIAAHLGEVLWEIGDLAGARNVWDAARGAHPDNEILLETLARYRPFFDGEN